MAVNIVVLSGRLTRDPELKYTKTKIAVASFGLAVNEKVKSGEEWVDKVQFFEIVAWGKTGENTSKYCYKGSQVTIEGKLNLNTWESNGEKKSRVEVVAKQVIFSDSKPRVADSPQQKPYDDGKIPF